MTLPIGAAAVMPADAPGTAGVHCRRAQRPDPFHDDDDEDERPIGDPDPDDDDEDDDEEDEDEEAPWQVHACARPRRIARVNIDDGSLPVGANAAKHSRHLRIRPNR